MQTHAQKAFDELEALGAPVIDRSEGKGCHFIISGESNDEIVWADYYKEFPMSYLDDFGVNKNINAILDKHGLYAEWYNSGFLAVYDA